MPSSSLLCIATTAALGAGILGCASRQSAALPNEAPGASEALGLTQLAVAPAVRRVGTLSHVDYWIRPSPDRRFLTLLDPETGKLVVRDMMDGTQRQVLEDAGEGQELHGGVISPDGNSIAFRWQGEGDGGPEVRIAGIGGRDSGVVRTIHASADVFEQDVHGWTPDGAEVLAVIVVADTGVQLVAIDARTGTTRILRSVEHRMPDHLAVSPDGQWLAFDYATRGMDRDVHLIRMDGSSHRVVMQSSGDDEVIGWSGAPARLLVLSQRGGTPAVWALSLREGNPVGEPILVRSDLWRSIPIGTAADGSLFYSVLVGDRGIHRALIGPAPSPREVGSTPLSQGESVPHFLAFEWAPDGERIAFAVQRGRTPKPMGLEEIVVRSVTGGNERRLAVPLTRTIRLQWYPDGRALLLFGVDDQDNFGLFRLDLERGTLDPVVMTSELEGGPMNLALTPDGSRVIFTSMDWPAVRLMAVPVTGGPPSLLRRIETGVGAFPRGFAMSPDGRHVALALRYYGREPGRIVIASLDGAPEREVHRLRSDERFALSALSYTPDGGNLLFGVATVGPNSDMVEIRKLRLDDGVVTSTGFRQPGLRAMSLSPDGTTLMYGVDQLGMELWAMDPPDFGPSPGGRP